MSSFFLPHLAEREILRTRRETPGQCLESAFSVPHKQCSESFLTVEVSDTAENHPED